MTSQVLHSGGRWQVVSRMDYRADIDGLRCIAVLAVVAFHAFPQRLPGGFVGVDVFFVISGYLITGILARLIASDGPLFSEFYRRRIRRIFPALIVVMLGTLAIGFVLLPAFDYRLLGKHIAAGAGFVSNLALWSETSYFDVDSATKPLLHLWSLGVEEQFYIGWPVLMLLFARRKWELLTSVLLIAAISLIASILMVARDPTAAFYSPFSRVWELLAGAALFAAEARGWRLSARAAHVASLAGLALLGQAIILLAPQSPFPGVAAIAPVAGTTLMVAAGPSAILNRSILALRPLVAVGLFSYPLYLWHWPLLTFAYLHYHQAQAPGPVRAVIVVASIALAWLTYRLIEQPAALRRHYTTAKLVTAMLVTLALGLAIFFGDGLPGRPANDARAQFIARFLKMHTRELGAAYREQCDFVKWGTLTTKERIDPRCFGGVVRPYVLLWGDSHAQALSLGLQATLGSVPLQQIATSSCRPDDHFDKAYYPNVTLKEACDRSNRLALRQIALRKPDLVVIALGGDHLAQDWPGLAAHLHRLGAHHVLLVGPLPQWQPSLPLVITADNWPYHGERVSAGLDRTVLAYDETLLVQSRGWTDLAYVSLIAAACNRAGCVAQVPGEPAGTLVTLDYGHLTPKGSLLFGRVLGPAVRLAMEKD